jgi:hypothetical protein
MASDAAADQAAFGERLRHIRKRLRFRAEMGSLARLREGIEGKIEHQSTADGPPPVRLSERIFKILGERVPSVRRGPSFGTPPATRRVRADEALLKVDRVLEKLKDIDARGEVLDIALPEESAVNAWSQPERFGLSQSSYGGRRKGTMQNLWHEDNRDLHLVEGPGMIKALTPPPGYTPAPGGRKGSYRKWVGGARRWDYWYPTGTAEEQTDQLGLFEWAPQARSTPRDRLDEYRSDLKEFAANPFTDEDIARISDQVWAATGAVGRELELGGLRAGLNEALGGSNDNDEWALNVNPLGSLDEYVRKVVAEAYRHRVAHLELQRFTEPHFDDVIWNGVALWIDGTSEEVAQDLNQPFRRHRRHRIALERHDWVESLDHSDDPLAFIRAVREVNPTEFSEDDLTRMGADIANHLLYKRDKFGRGLTKGVLDTYAKERDSLPDDVFAGRDGLGSSDGNLVYLDDFDKAFQSKAFTMLMVEELGRVKAKLRYGRELTRHQMVEETLSGFAGERDSPIDPSFQTFMDDVVKLGETDENLRPIAEKITGGYVSYRSFAHLYVEQVQQAADTDSPQLGHWGSANESNEVAWATSLYGDGGRFRPLNTGMRLQEVTAEHGESDQHRAAKARYVYAQEEIDRFPRESHPNVWRGMGIPSALAASLEVGETLPLTGCTAFTFHEHIADRYSDSEWTRSKTGADMVPMKIELERTQDFDDSVAGWHHSHSSDNDPAFEIVSGINALEVVEIVKTGPISEANRRNFTAKTLTSKNSAPLIPLHLYIEGHKGTLRRLDGPRELYEGQPLDEEYEDYLEVWRAWGGKWTVDDEGIPGLSPGQDVLGRELYGLLQRIPKLVTVKVKGVPE